MNLESVFEVAGDIPQHEQPDKQPAEGQSAQPEPQRVRRPRDQSDIPSGNRRP